MKFKKLFVIISSSVLMTSCASTAAVFIAKKISNDNNISSDVKDTNTYTITFDAAGGILTGQTTLKIKENQKFGELSNVPSVTREGAGTNPGWFYTTLEGSRVYVDENSTFTSDVTLCANWTTYHVSFDPGEGSFSGDKTPIEVKDTTYIHSDEVKTPKCDGKAFDGWYDSEDNKITFPYTPHSNLTVTAKYTTNIVKLGFSSTEGYFDTSSVTTKIIDIAYGKTWLELKQEGSLPNNPSYDGEKKFSTWQLNDVDVSDNQKFTRTMLINAHYEQAITCTFNVISNGGEWLDKTTTNKTSSKLILIDEPTFAQFKDAAGVTSTTSSSGNYELLGWFSDTYATNAAYKDDDKITETHNFTVYAYYKVPHTISFTGTTSGYTISEEIKTFVRKDNIKYTINGATGYTLTTDNVKVSWNGETKTLGTDYSFSVNNNVGSLNIFEGPGYDITVEVTPSLNSYTITQNKGTGVSALNVAGSGTYTDSIQVTATAASGYTLNSIEVRKTSDSSLVATISSGESFTMPYYPVTVYATATANTYNISKTSVTGVSSYSVVSSAQYTAMVSVSATASTGYSISYIYIKQNGTTISTITGSSGTFKMPIGDVTVQASVSKITYSITTTSVTGVSSYSVTGTKQLNETITVSATASTGYKVNYIYVYKGSSTSAYATITGSSGTFKMPASNCTVTASVSKISYTVSCGTVTNATVKSSKSSANYQDKVTATVTPSAGYYVSKITIKYSSSSGSDYTSKTFSQSTSAQSLEFTMPASTMFITATVTKCTFTITTSPQSNVSSLTTNPASKTTSGTSVTATATPNSNYYISKIEVLNSSGTAISTQSFTQASGSKTLTFTMPNDSNVTVKAYATQWQYTITTVVRTGLSSYSNVPTSATSGTTITPKATSVSGATQNCYKYVYGSTTGSKSFGTGFTMPQANVTIYNYLSSFTINSSNYNAGTMNLYYKKGTSNSCGISSSGSGTSYVGYGLYGQSARTSSTSYGWVTTFKSLGLSGPAKGEADKYLYYFSGTSTSAGNFYTQTRKTYYTSGGDTQKSIGSDVNVYIESF